MMKHQTTCKDNTEKISRYVKMGEKKTTSASKNIVLRYATAKGNQIGWGIKIIIIIIICWQTATEAIINR